jgi:hypothetical protein
MSLDLYVLSREPLPDTAAWQEAIAAEGYPIRLSASMPISALGGFLPVALGDDETGFECSLIDVSDVIETYPENGLEGGEWQSALVFYFGADAAEGYAANAAAAAYAKATNGVVFDPQAGEVMTDEDSRKEIEGFRLMMEE